MVFCGPENFGYSLKIFQLLLGVLFTCVWVAMVFLEFVSTLCDLYKKALRTLQNSNEIMNDPDEFVLSVGNTVVILV